MNVYEQAHGLAAAIKASEEFRQFDELRKRVEANPDLNGMIKDYERKQMEFQAKQMTGEMSAENMQQQMSDLYAVVMKDPLAAQYLQAQMRFSVMMADVYKILGDAMGIGNPF
ncbi:YlbF family regulator [Eubacterium sp. AB3007]|uniref:YlbF family regulator n=1 Tax=Eubacterium sp. AB3007 TaxID=1392487 RepID=UPI000487BBF7|nr:YlbF family regulator [Eubacterium sp. AB3007]